MFTGRQRAVNKKKRDKQIKNKALANKLKALKARKK